MYRNIARGFVALAGSLLVTVCTAQEGVSFTSPRAEALRSFTIQQQGLNSGALNLSLEQKAEINKILAAYVNEQIGVEDRLPAEQRQSDQAAKARATALANLTGELGKVMNAEQRVIWETAARRQSFMLGGATVTAPKE